MSTSLPRISTTLQADLQLAGVGISRGDWLFYFPQPPKGVTLLPIPLNGNCSVKKNQAVAKSPLTMLSVFTGAGGLDLGLEAAGFRSIGHIELCPKCRESLALNRPEWKELDWTDIHLASKEATPKRLGIKKGELDLLAGAPPCQPFSTAAQWSGKARLGLSDTRAKTLGAFLNLAEKFLPSTILIENVPTFWNPNFGAQEVIKQFFSGLRERTGISYRFDSKVLNAADFGVPQQRRRFILVAHRTDKVWTWPTARYSENPRTVWDALHSVTSKDLPKPKGKWAELLPSIPKGCNYQWHSSVGEGLEIFGPRTRFWSFLLKLSPDLPSWTLAAQPGPSTGPFHWDNRPLSLEESLALQTFPQGWKLAGNYRDGVKMIGNATPPLLGEHLGRQIVRTLFEGQLPSNIKFAPKKARSVPNIPSPEKVPKKYLNLVSEHKPHPGTGLGPKPRLANVHQASTLAT